MNAMPPGRVAHYLQMRSAAIQYLRMLEDELVSMEGIRDVDRAVMTRRERRAAAAQLSMEGIRDHVLTDESASDTLRTSE